METKGTLKFGNRIMLTALFVLLLFGAFAQNNTTVFLRNCSSTSNTLDFELYIRNTGANPMILQSGAYGIDWNGSGAINGGTPTVAYVPGTSGLSSTHSAFTGTNTFISQPAQCATCNYSIRLNAIIATSPATGTNMPPGVDVKVGQFRITNTQNWTAGAATNFSFVLTNTSGKTTTRLSTYYNGSAAGSVSVLSPAPTVEATCVLNLNNSCANPPTANAGGPYTSCGNVPVTATVGGSATGGTWSSATGGTFDAPGALSTVYHPSAADLSNGSVTLTFTSNNPAGGACVPAVSNASVTFTAVSDGNPCTVDECPAGGGVATHTPVNTDDNNVCTTDGCDPVTGPFHTPISVDDNNACTTDGCDPVTGPFHNPVNTDDNNVCTTDGCDPVTGVFHTPISVDDNNACTTDACDPITGPSHAPVNTDDGNACTTDGCDPVTGVFHNPVNTNDNNVCTTDGCDPVTGVFHTPISVDDNNACTTDGCDPVTGPSHTPVNTDDNNACTTDGCDPVTGVFHNAVNTNDNNACTTDGCDPVTGVFHNPVNTDDNNVCTTDGCDPVTGVFHTPISVDDNNACTTDACDPITGPSHTPVNTNDNNACTTDGCDPVTGIFHNPVNTDDNNACTTDGCDPVTGVFHNPVNTDDNNVCTTDGCDPVTGVFHNPVNTNDNNVCTTDGCDPVTGVFHTPISVDDNNACTTDACDPVTGPSHTPVNTNDNNACTTDGCDPVTGIFHNPVNTDDNNVCTTDGCDPVTGVFHTPISVDDNNACTTDACDPVTGPSHTPVNTNDNNACTTDGCDPVTGVFHNAVNTNDNNVCTTDGCDPVTGVFHTPISVDDNNACTTDACDPITGPSHTPVNTDDSNVCTTDGCDPVTGVFHNPVANGTVCGAGDACSNSYSCQAGVCTPGSPLNVDDNNACTTDGCDPVTGPFHNPVNTDDNNACTTDACDPVTGPSHTPVNTNDNNACTTDGCDPVTGVFHNPVNTNDNNVCTTDGCDPVTGVFHTPISVDDNNVCTTDACDPVTGPSHTPVNTNDNNACTTDGCDPVTGPFHTPVNTNDNNVCTTDGCDPVTGVFHNPISVDDGNPCTTDGCDPITGPFHTPIDLDGDGFTACAGDCNDNNAAVNPNAIEVCDGIDNNCNGVTDEGCGGCAVPPTANAGGDQGICADDNVSLSGSIGGSATQGTWTTSGTGSFVPNANALNATYIPSNADIALGTVTLTLTTDAPVGCTPASDFMVVTITPLPPTPGTVSGPALICNPASTATFVYSIASVPGATGYNWTVPANTIIVSGQGTTSLTVRFVSSAVHLGIVGDICVTTTNGGPCGNSAPSCISISVQATAPVTPGSISGANKACPGDVVMYSISPVSRAAFYTWTLPPNSSLVGPNGGLTVTVQYNAGFTGGTLSVVAGNGCGVSPARTRAILFNQLPAPGAISGPASGVCNEQDQMYCVAPVAGATSYQWTVPAGATIDGSATGNCIIVDFGNVAPGSITVAAVNACGAGAVRSLAITGVPATPGTISGPTTVCTGQTYTYQINTVAGASTYTWTVPGGATIMNGQGTKIIDLKFSNTPATNMVVSVKASNACGTSGARSLSGISSSFCIRATGAGFTELNAYPNPTKDLLNVDFSSDVDQDYVITLVDVAGRAVFNQSNTATTGVNNLQLDVKGLSSGVYMLNFKMGDANQQIRIFVE